MRKNYQYVTAIISLLLAGATITVNGSTTAPDAKMLAVQPVTVDLKVGALFAPGTNKHHCTASVIHSPHGDLIITAAHCVVKDGAGMMFAPGYQNGVSPLGSWKVNHAFLPTAWKKNRDTRADIAILKLNYTIENKTGANVLSTTTPHSGVKVKVTGYREGAGDRQISCEAKLQWSLGYPAFICDGYSNGVSGSPFVSKNKVIGVIGGFEEGGSTSKLSYSVDVGGKEATVQQLLHEASQ